MLPVSLRFASPIRSGRLGNCALAVESAFVFVVLTDRLLFLHQSRTWSKPSSELEQEVFTQRTRLVGTTLRTLFREFESVWCLMAPRYRKTSDARAYYSVI